MIKERIKRLVVKVYGGDPDELEESVRLQRERIKEREAAREAEIRRDYWRRRQQIMRREQ